jgi:hypothetical protein
VPPLDHPLEANGALIIAAVSIGLFVAIWLAVSFLLSRVGGWKALSQVYRSQRAVPTGGWVERRVLLSGRARYKNVLRLTADTEGLYLSVAFPFRLGHPPLFVPWGDLMLLPGLPGPSGYTELRFRRVLSPRILVPDASIERLGERAPGPWRTA